MRVILNAPENFQSIFQRLIELETASSPVFHEMMEVQVENQTRNPSAVGLNRRQSVRVPTPEEATAAQNSNLGN